MSELRNIETPSNGQLCDLYMHFALGGAPGDKDPHGAWKVRNLRNEFADSANVMNMGEALNTLEIAFGPGLGANIPPDLKLHYRIMNYEWSEIFIGLNYAKLHAESVTGKNAQAAPRFVIGKLESEWSRNSNNKRRFLCQAQTVTTHGKNKIIRPVLVCEDDSVANNIEPLLKKQETFILSGRPWISPYGETNPSEIYIFLNIPTPDENKPLKHDQLLDQIRLVPEDYWIKSAQQNQPPASVQQTQAEKPQAIEKIKARAKNRLVQTPPSPQMGFEFPQLNELR